MREVVIVLPFQNEKVLMQLRDFNPQIGFPGCWGFFGGSIDEGETPEQAARRELEEELGFKPAELHKLGQFFLQDLVELISHAFYCDLPVPISTLPLTEGADLTLVSMSEVETKAIYSPKLGKKFPIAHPDYISARISQALTLIRGN